MQIVSFKNNKYSNNEKIHSILLTGLFALARDVQLSQK